MDNTTKDAGNIVNHQAGRVDTVSAAIMNLPCPHKPSFPFSSGPVATEQLRAYKEGHRDARHAAAELVNEHAAALDSRAQPVACTGCDPAEGFCKLCRDAEKRALSAQPVALDGDADPEILGAVARGWCAPANAHKVMDSDLAFAIAQEVERVIARSAQPVAAGELTDEQIDSMWRNSTTVGGDTTQAFVRHFARSIQGACADSRPAGGVTDQPSHEEIIREGETFVCTACGTTTPAATLAASAAQQCADSRPAGGAADRDAVLEEAALACSDWGDELVIKWQNDEEMFTNAKARAWDSLQCAARIRALKSKPAATLAASAAQPAPDGWKLAPIEPTQEMYLAACRAYINWLALCDSEAAREVPHLQPDFKHADVYRAMLAAAPASPTAKEAN